LEDAWKSLSTCVTQSGHRTFRTIPLLHHYVDIILFNAVNYFEKVERINCNKGLSN